MFIFLQWSWPACWYLAFSHTNFSAQQMVVELPTMGKSWEKYDRPPYYFPDVKLGMEGFEFTEITECHVDDSLPVCANILGKDKRMAAMNNLFFVYANNNKTTVTILFRENIRHVADPADAPTPTSPTSPPPFIPRSGFEDIANPEKFYNFYTFSQLKESEYTQIKFKSPVLKILLSGDQVIFMLKDRVVIYTMFSSSTIEVEPLDIAVSTSRHLYILTEKSIMVYGERLLTQIEIDKKCRFVIPTPLHIFVIRQAIVYKIADGVAQPYADMLKEAQSCCFDERFMYITTGTALFKMSLYDRDITGIRFNTHSLRVHLCDTHLIIHDSNSGLMYLDKSDFSKFAVRNMDIALCDLATYGNTVAYLCLKEILFCEYRNSDGNLELVEPSFGREAEKEKMSIQEVCDVEDAVEVLRAPYPYHSYGMVALQRKSKSFKRLLEFETGMDVLSLLPRLANTKIEASSPLAPGNPYGALFSTTENFIDETDYELAWGDDFRTKLTEEELTIVEKATKRACRCVRKAGYVVDESSSESGEGLFFDLPENAPLRDITHPVLKAIPSFKQTKTPPKRKNIPLYKVFKKIFSKIKLTHPIPYLKPQRTIRRGKINAIVQSESASRYVKPLFFVKNHFEYFKNRFNARKPPMERPYRGIIYSFVIEELSRNSERRVPKAESKTEKPKKRMGGF